jgi:tRNA dimethylallyltransferase
MPPMLALAGPTASGKTAAALAIADVLPVEIVSVDSALVYRGMDIGTAKPSAAERARVPHHLVDVIDPAASYSAAQFVADATRLAGEIHARGNVPLLVGGTMLYFKALFEGLDAMPASDPAVRAGLDRDAAQRGWPALHAELAKVDPATAARLPPNDSQRIQRALEVWRLTGRPLSSFHRGKRAGDAPPLLSLEPQDRAWLHARIAQRFDAMLAAGFVDEVRRLRLRGDLHPGLPSMRCVGYRQAWEALDAGRLDALRDTGIAATRQLAKRQLTWLRGMRRDVVACDAPDATAQVVQRALALVKDARRAA